MYLSNSKLPKCYDSRTTEGRKAFATLMVLALLFGLSTILIYNITTATSTSSLIAWSNVKLQEHARKANLATFASDLSTHSELGELTIIDDLEFLTIAGNDGQALLIDTASRIPSLITIPENIILSNPEIIVR